MIVLPKTFLNNFCETMTQRETETKRTVFMLFYGKFKEAERLGVRKKACNIHLTQKSCFFSLPIFTQLGKYCVCFSNTVYYISNPTVCNQNSHDQVLFQASHSAEVLQTDWRFAHLCLKNNTHFRRKQLWGQSDIPLQSETFSLCTDLVLPVEHQQPPDTHPNASALLIHAAAATSLSFTSSKTGRACLNKMILPNVISRMYIQNCSTRAETSCKGKGGSSWRRCSVPLTELNLQQTLPAPDSTAFQI